MKFKIRFADQIVGLFIILALLSLIFVIIMLGRSQRWFAKDTSFRTEFVSATGLSKNMPVLYRGFTIGNVKEFRLNGLDQVEVIFFIYEEYRDRVRYGSMVELMISPVGLGNQFLFHAGKGDDLLEAGEFIPNVDSLMARDFIRQGIADDPYHDDSISLILNRVNQVLGDVEEALRTGTDNTALGQIIGGVNRTIAGLEVLPGTVNTAVESLVVDIDDIKLMLDGLLAEIQPILSDLNVLSSQLADPKGTIAQILDGEGPVYVSLADSLESLSGILESLDKIAAFVPRELPQLAGLITDLRVTLRTAEDVLVALTNNPLLRKGIPDRIEVQSSGTSPRDIQF